jgi:hypothetical protein
MSPQHGHTPEHPLESLYRARDAAQDAAVNARHIGMLSAERSIYERTLADLLQALNEVTTVYNVTLSASPPARGNEADTLLEHLVRLLPDQRGEASAEAGIDLDSTEAPSRPRLQ